MCFQTTIFSFKQHYMYFHTFSLTRISTNVFKQQFSVFKHMYQTGPKALDLQILGFILSPKQIINLFLNSFGKKKKKNNKRSKKHHKKMSFHIQSFLNWVINLATTNYSHCPPQFTLVFKNLSHSNFVNPMSPGFIFPENCSHNPKLNPQGGGIFIIS